MNEYSIQLADIFLRGDEQVARSFVQELLAGQSRLQLYEDLITPAMVHIGKLWEQNKISVADEHLATAVCDYVISDHEFRYAAKEPGSRGKVMLFGVEGEEHYIGLKMAAAVFREHGWTVRYLGPDLPLRHAETAVNAWQPDVVAMSAALSYRLPMLKKSVQVLADTASKPRIVIGGRMAPMAVFDEDLAPGQVIVMTALHDLHNWLASAGQGVIPKHVIL